MWSNDWVDLALICVWIGVWSVLVYLVPIRAC